MREQRSQRFGREPVPDDDARGAAAVELLVQVVIVLAAGEGDDLRGHVGAELLLAVTALDEDVRFALVLAEPDELQRNDVFALVEELVERVLAVCARLAEQHRPGGVVHGLAEAVDGLAVGFHVGLLQVCRETGKSLRVGQDRRALVSQDVSLVHPDERVEHRGVFQRARACRDAVGLGGAFQEPREDLGAESQRQHRAAHCRGGRIAPADVVVHEERLEVTAVLGEGRGLARDRDHVVGRVQARLDQRVFHERLVGQRLERGAGLGDEDEKRVGHVDGAQHVYRVVGVDVADEAGFHFLSAFGAGPVLERQVHGARSQVASADANLHDGCEGLAGGVGHLAAVHLAGKLGDPLLLIYVKLALVDPVGYNGISQLPAGQMVQDQALLASVDHGAVVQLGEFLGQLRFFCQICQLLQKGVVDLLGAVAVRKTARHGQDVAFHPLRSLLAFQNCAQVDPRSVVYKRLICIESVEVLPVCHAFRPSYERAGIKLHKRPYSTP